jgi:hypothetical protein
MKRTPVKKRRTKPRRGPMRDPGYRRWLRQGRCLVTWLLGNVCDCDSLLSDAAHTQNNGMASKGPDSSCVPLCRKHHREYDAGRKAFETKYAVDMKVEAAKFYDQYLRN